MSASDSDPARAPRAPENSTNEPAPTGRFTRRPAGPGDVASRVAAAETSEPVFPQEGDVWSHEVGTRRFEPGRAANGGYAVDASIHEVAKPRPPSTGPSIVTRAFEQTVPPPSVVDTPRSPSAFVTDALTELAAEDASHAPAPPRRDPGTPSTPPPGFGS